jgi:DNA polymerase
MGETPMLLMLSTTIQPTFDSWREAARKLLIRQISPDQVIWSDQTEDNLLPDLFDDSCNQPIPAGKLPRVPAAFIASARTASLFRDPARWSLLYRILHRLTHGEPNLLKITIDDDTAKLISMEKLVRRDIHKMHAFVRFRSVIDETGEQMIAWHRPDHLIVPAIGPWFARRFPIMRWTILTPDASVAWDLKTLHYGPGVPRSAAPAGDDLEDLWKTYYASIFNPARVKVAAMKKEMPVRHWATLPEAELIDDLLRKATPRVETFMPKADDAQPAVVSAAAFVPKSLELSVLRAAAADCKGCDLCHHATQTVFGQGPETASVMFIGEQPGDKEDLAGKPFIGPAGQMLDRGLIDAGIDRGEVYVTNAVKHFKFEPRGSRRIHAKPNAREMAACRPWLEAEIASVRPKLIVCLGATAAQSLLGPQFRITKDRGKIFTDTTWAPALLATNHPSAILRVPDEQGREDAYAHFVADLKIVRNKMETITREQANAAAEQHAKSLPPSSGAGW